LSRLWWRGGFPKAFLASSDRHAYFWGTHSGAELDLLLSHNGRRLGVEFKFTDRPATTKSMRVVQQDLMLDHLYVVHPGEHTFALDTAITASHTAAAHRHPAGNELKLKAEPAVLGLETQSFSRLSVNIRVHPWHRKHQWNPASQCSHPRTPVCGSPNRNPTTVH
jgi:hypothetical protein